MSTMYPVYVLTGAIAGESFAKGGGLTGQDGNGTASGQFLFVKGNGTLDTYVHCSADNDKPIGISVNDPISGGELSIQALGRCKITCGAGGLALNDEVGTDTAGRGIKKTTGTTGADLGDYVMGVCVKAGAVGEIADIEMIGRYQISL